MDGGAITQRRLLRTRTVRKLAAHPAGSLGNFRIITPVALTADDLTRAARLQWDDYEDCLIAIAAQKARADYLITRDAKGFDRSMVPALSPTAWLDLMEDKGLVYDAVTFPKN